MSVNLSCFAGTGAQFFDNSALPLAGGMISTYLAGTTTPIATYTDNTGLVANTNPIVLDAAGRTPYQIWLADGALYKFVVKTSNAVLIGTNDNVPAVGGSLSSNNLITVSGTNTLTSTSNFAAYTAGMQLSFIPANTNTAAATLNINSLGVKSITYNGTSALAPGLLKAGKIAIVEYDGTQFQLLNAGANSFVYSILFGL